MNIKSREFLLNQIFNTFNDGNFSESAKLIKQFLEIYPNDLEGFLAKGVISSALGDHIGAVQIFDQIISNDPNNADAMFYKGNSLFCLNLLKPSIQAYENALNINRKNLDCLLNMGDTYFMLGEYSNALKCFYDALELNPRHTNLLNNIGATLHELREYENAYKYYKTLLEIDPNHANAWANMGNTLLEMNDFDGALNAFDAAIESNPNFAGAYFNKANLLFQLKQFKNALSNYLKASSIDKNYPYVRGSILHTSMQICDWTDFDKRINEISERIKNDNGHEVHPFHALSFLSDESLHLASTKIWMSKKIKQSNIATDIGITHNPKKIKLGYFSADFYDHAVSCLIAELFELHDREKFEVIGFFYGHPKKDAMHERLSASFDQFIDVHNFSDQQTANLANELSIDIAIDLTGLTKNGRPGIFSNRAAPIQVNYLGYPGTLGVNFYDYLIADQQLIPESSRKFFVEKIAYLPYSYQANDSQQLNLPSTASRIEYGLPPTGFVFCCFNNNYKISPSIFKIWMEILKDVDQSVLWLLEDNPQAKSNLQKHAIQNGIDSERLIFAHKTSRTEHLARHNLADLFLDTLPYNAHTTASDSLRTGLPILTCTGSSFAGRVATSLLRALDVPELISVDLFDYKNKAIALAKSPGQLLQIKRKIGINKFNSPLFNSKKFTLDIENLYAEMITRKRTMIAPEHIILGVS